MQKFCCTHIRGWRSFTSGSTIPRYDREPEDVFPFATRMSCLQAAVAQPGGSQTRRGGPRFFCGGPDGSELPLEEPRFPEIRAPKYMNTSDMISWRCQREAMSKVSASQCLELESYATRNF